MKKNILTSLSLSLALTASSSAFAGQLTYRCTPADNTAGDVTFVVGNSHFVKVDEDVADLDDSYEPRVNEGYARFEYEHSDEGVSEVLVQERLLKGSRYGFIKLQNRGEGFDSQKYACTLQ